MIRLGRWKISGVPDYFVARYFHEFVKWAKMIPTGDFPATYLITFNEGDLAEDSPDPEQGKQLLGGWLLAKISSRFIECEPYSELDRDRIRKHCDRMQRAGVRSRDRLVEPERPGIPVIPWRH